MASPTADDGAGASSSRLGKSKEAADTPTKPKITKSRNGCVTCKAKRLKCDETKPTCLQCRKRNVECGGYKKDFKWKSFEESSFMKPGNRRKASTSEQTPRPKDVANPNMAPPTPTPSNSSVSTASLIPPSLSTTTTSSSHPSQSPRLDQFSATASLSPTYAPSDASGSRSPPSAFIPSPLPYPSAFDPTMTASMDAIGSQGSLMDLGLPGLQPRRFSLQMAPQEMGQRSVAQSMAQLAYPQNPEALLSIFINDTSNIISMDRSNSNPWKKIMLPIARNCPSLMHAILAFTAFRASTQRPEFKARGIEHKAEALRHLGSELASLSATQALATTLALSIAEAFDSSQTLPEQYLLLSRTLVARILTQIRQNAINAGELEQASFVMNHWLYLDVMTSLTSKTHAFDVALSHEILITTRSLGVAHPLNSCMGIAVSLFPFIGRVANLIRVVRRSQIHDPNIQVEAENLKQLLMRWGPIHVGSSYGIAEEDMDDFKCTAEALRWAALLLLHQTVPDVSLKSSAQIANRILKLLSSVDSASPCLIAHTFPLLMAGCEVSGEQGRSWVMGRWQEIDQLLQVNVVGKCIELTCEVWRRRDGAMGMPAAEDSQRVNAYITGFHGSTARQHSLNHSIYDASLDPNMTMTEAFDQAAFATQTAPQLGSFQGEVLSEAEILRILGDVMGQDLSVSSDLGGPPMGIGAMSGQSPEILERLPFEQTVRGSQHWLGIMEEWGWEVCLC